MKQGLKFIGKVVSGLEQGAYFIQIDWVQMECLQKLGFRPYPGTFNLETLEDYHPILEYLEKEKGIDLTSPDPKFCNAKAFHASIGNMTGAIIIPDEEVRVHDKNIIEIIAQRRLRDDLKVEDGDSVTVVVHKP